MKNHLPHLPRARDRIDPALREKLNGLFRGELPWPLFLSGPAGTGKTSAALTALDLCGGAYWTVKELHDTLIAAAAGKHFTTGTNGCSFECGPLTIWAGIGRVRLAVLDELGQREKVSDPQYETVKQFIDVRDYRPAIFISNLGLAELDAIYDRRVTDRLGAGTRHALGGKSGRTGR